MSKILGEVVDEEITTTVKMLPIEIVGVKVKDRESGVIFNVYPEGEIGWVTYHRPYYDSTHNLDYWIKIRNNTDEYVTAYWSVLDPNGNVIVTKYVGLYANQEYDEWSTTPLISNLPAFPATYTIEAWASGKEAEKHIVTFTVDEGNFLWISSNFPCEVEVIGEIRVQYPESGLYIFPHNAPVSLNAKPPFCHVFQKWIINSTEYYENPVSFSVYQNFTATVYFESVS